MSAPLTQRVLDWRAVGRATLTLDFLGFGLSDKPRDCAYSLIGQADIVERLVGGEARPVIVVAHDMGTSVATELLARDLEGTLASTSGACCCSTAG